MISVTAQLSSLLGVIKEGGGDIHAMTFSFARFLLAQRIAVSPIHYLMKDSMK